MADKQTDNELHKEIVQLVEKQRELSESNHAESKEALEKVEKELGEKFEKIDTLNNDLRVEKKAREEADKRLDDLEKEVSLANLSAKNGDEYIRTKADDALAGFMRVNEFKGFDDWQAYRDQSAEELSQIMAKGADDFHLDLVRKDLISGINPDGGFFVPPAPMRTIETKVFETSPIRPLASILTTTSDSFKFVVDDDEADSGWVGEVDTRADTGTPKINEIIIPIHEIFAQPRATQTMLDDAGFNIEGWLTNKVSTRFVRQENLAFVAGDGSKKPKGFTDFAASADPDVYEFNTVGQLETAGSGVIASDDIKSIVGLLKEDYQSNAVFGMKRATWTEITKLKDSQGRYLFDMISNLRDGDIMQLLGQSVVLMNDMPDIATGALSVVYGDFREFYTIIDRMGIRILRDPFTAKPFVKFYTTKRVGGSVTNFEAAKLLKIKA